MEKYKTLLDSNIKEDIALGLFLAHRDGLLKEGDYYKGWKDPGFSIQFDDWTIWVSPAFSCIRIRKIGGKSLASMGVTRWGESDFDFRTKKEE